MAKEETAPCVPPVALKLSILAALEGCPAGQGLARSYISSGIGDFTLDGCGPRTPTGTTTHKDCHFLRAGPDNACHCHHLGSF
jgi:hypothetical protein